MQVFETETQLGLQTLVVGQTVFTQGRVTAGDNLGAVWLIEASGTGVDLADGNVAVMQQLTPEMINGGVGGGGSPVESVAVAAGIVETGTAADPILGLDYEIVTEVPTDVTGTVDGHLWFVVDA
jgi:hypothetical protein